MNDSIKPYLDQVHQLIEAGDKPAALKIARQLCKAYPSRADVWWAAAQALENPDHQRQALRRVLAIDPQHPLARRQMEVLNQTPSIVTGDGELAFEMPVEKPKYPYRPKRRSNLTQRLALMLAALVVLFGGTALAALYVQSVQTASVTEMPSLARIPAEFAYAPYHVRAQFGLTADPLPPCSVRTVLLQVDVPGDIKVRLWSWPEDGTLDMTAQVEPDKRRITFEIPAEEAEVFNFSFYDAADTMIYGMNKIQLGFEHVPYCMMLLTFGPGGN